MAITSICGLTASIAVLVPDTRRFLINLPTLLLAVVERLGQRVSASEGDGSGQLHFQVQEIALILPCSLDILRLGTSLISDHLRCR